MPGRKTCRLHRQPVVRHADNVRAQTNVNSVFRIIEKMTMNVQKCRVFECVKAKQLSHTLRLVEIVLGTWFTEVLTWGNFQLWQRSVLSVPPDWLLVFFSAQNVEQPKCRALTLFFTLFFASFSSPCCKGRYSYFCTFPFRPVIKILMPCLVILSFAIR